MYLASHGEVCVLNLVEDKAPGPRSGYLASLGSRKEKASRCDTDHITLWCTNKSRKMNFNIIPPKCFCGMIGLLLSYNKGK